MSYKKKRSLHHRFLPFMFLRRIFCNIYPFSVKFLSAVTADVYSASRTHLSVTGRIFACVNSEVQHMADRHQVCRYAPMCSSRWQTLLKVAGGKLYPYEIKSVRTWRSDFANNLRSFAERDAKIEKGTVIYAGKLRIPFRIRLNSKGFGAKKCRQMKIPANVT